MAVMRVTMLSSTHFRKAWCIRVITYTPTNRNVGIFMNQSEVLVTDLVVNTYRNVLNIIHYVQYIYVYILGIV